jgi:hypothetical protein
VVWLCIPRRCEGRVASDDGGVLATAGGSGGWRRCSCMERKLREKAIAAMRSDEDGGEHNGGRRVGASGK